MLIEELNTEISHIQQEIISARNKINVAQFRLEVLQAQHLALAEAVEVIKTRSKTS